MSVRDLLQSFEQWREQGQGMVLATVFETVGSTYSKAGHRILIAANGDYQGLVSGGCLEGDLAERAAAVLANGKAEAVSYDLRDEVDDLWGLGVGCNGLIRVFLQPLHAEHGYQPFAAIAACLLAKEPAVVATVVSSAQADLDVGATMLWSPSSTECWGLDAARVDALIPACKAALAARQSRYRDDEDGNGVLYAVLRPVPRLLILGAGQDAIPLVGMAAELGWIVSVADHRPSYIARKGFAAADSVTIVEPKRLDATLDLTSVDAVVVMSHHLLTDQAYLERLAAFEIPYVGVLGPAARKQRLLDALGDAAGSLRTRLKGPVGLDIGADSPESIALSILAELQAVFRERA